MFSLYIGLLTIFWLLLNEELGVLQVVMGLGGGTIALMFVERYLLSKEYRVFYSIPLTNFLGYLLVLLFQIYVSGVKAIYYIFSNKVKVEIAKYESDLENDFSLCLLAISITLTPGTVTVDKSGKTLQILHLYHQKEKGNRWQQDIREKLENPLKGG
ncbi:MAG: Na+/H+ antiporter subunit E [Pseudothermotoga sp.]